jgi:hypothetical protein
MQIIPGFIARRILTEWLKPPFEPLRGPGVHRLASVVGLF